MTAVAVGSTVHDFVTVSGGAGNPVPTGSVTIDWFLNGTCTGAPATTSAALALGPAGTSTRPRSRSRSNTAGQPRVQGALPRRRDCYLASDGPCEPLSVVDANIQITPNGTNPVGDERTRSPAHVNVNDGTGFVNAPAGTHDHVHDRQRARHARPRRPRATTGGATGSCTTTITSAVAGVDDRQRTHDGVRRRRHADARHERHGRQLRPGDRRRGSTARITITPDATNEVGQPHTFTVTVRDRTPAPASSRPPSEHVDFTLTDSNGAAHTAADRARARRRTEHERGRPVHDHLHLQLGGQGDRPRDRRRSRSAACPVTVSTNGVAPNSADAVKTFVDAHISITPNGTNPVGATHVVHGPRRREPRQRRRLRAGARTGRRSPSRSPPGRARSPAARARRPAAPAAARRRLTSLVPGTTVVNASTTLTVSGVSLTRTTNGAAGNSGPATKLWADAAVRTDVHNAAHVADHDGQLGRRRPRQGVRDQGGRHAGRGARTDRQRHLPPLHEAQLHRRLGRRDRAAGGRRHGRDEHVHVHGGPVLQGRLLWATPTTRPAPGPASRSRSRRTSVRPARRLRARPSRSSRASPAPAARAASRSSTPRVKGTLIEITIQNDSSNGDAAMTKLHITWPAANGALKSVSLERLPLHRARRSRAARPI